MVAAALRAVLENAVPHSFDNVDSTTGCIIKPKQRRWLKRNEIPQIDICAALEKADTIVCKQEPPKVERGCTVLPNERMPIYMPILLPLAQMQKAGLATGQVNVSIAACMLSS